MCRKLVTITLTLCCSLASAAQLFAQLGAGESPTVVPARFGTSDSPNTPSTTPLGGVPERTTTYFWPEPARASAVRKVAKTSFSPTTTPSLAPEGYTTKVQTLPATWSQPVQSLRPAADIAPTLESSGGSGSGTGFSPPCVCAPAGQASSYGPKSAYVPQGSYVRQGSYPGPSSSPPVYAYQPWNGYRPTAAYRPGMPVSPLPGDYYFGHGLIGQPKVYVPGQPVRNALRYITP